MDASTTHDFLVHGTLPLCSNPLFYADDDVSEEEFCEKIKAYDLVFLTMQSLGGCPISKLKNSSHAKVIAQDKVEVYAGAVTLGPRSEIVNLSKIVSTNQSNGYFQAFKSRVFPMTWLDKEDVGFITMGLNKFSLNNVDEQNSSQHQQHHHHHHNHCQKSSETIPTTSSARFDNNKSTCGVICNPLWLETRREVEAAPRVTAIRMLEKLRAKHGLFLMCGFEPEFRLLKAESIFAATEDPRITLPQSRAAPVPAFRGNDLLQAGVLSKLKPFISLFDAHLRAANVIMQDFIIEQGEGQVEAPLAPEMGLKAADDMFIFKLAARGTAMLQGLYASFMAHPLTNTSSNGNHFNHSLWTVKNGENCMANAFVDETDPDGLSELARYWIGGILHHLPALCALVSPTVNCYRRAHSDWTPTAGTWGMNDRYAAMRVKTGGQAGVYMENRLPSSASCPYVTLAGTIAAGMDGIERKLTPPRAGVKPRLPFVGTNCPYNTLADTTNSEVAQLTKVPKSLDEALNNLKADKELTMMLGEEFVNWFIDVKRIGEMTTLAGVNLEDKSTKGLEMERYEYLEYI